MVLSIEQKGRQNHMAQPRIHILGLGSIGLFAAHVFAEAQPQPAITLLAHRPGLVNDYISNGSCISLRTHDGEILRQTNYDLEVLRDGSWFHVLQSPSVSTSAEHSDSATGGEKEAREPIKCLVVSVKAWQTATAISPLKHRLGRDSTILFIQNGSGMIEAVNQAPFQDPATRPRYIMGVTSHCINLLSPFNIEHAAFAKTSLGIVPREETTASNLEIRSQNLGNVQASPSQTGTDETMAHLTNLLTSVPRMNAISYPYIDLLQLQLEKLTINAVNNPICALADSKNEHLWTETALRNALFAEISSIALRLPELAGVPGVEERFSPEKLEKVVLDNLKKTEKGTCSMVWDLRCKRRTEVRFINGYWVRRGGEVGVPSPVNMGLVRRIEEREAMYL